jgi:hypothetical protein
MSGRSNQLTKQVGEYLVAAEVCRRGFIATTFTGNVPFYDIVASNATGGHQAIQVKAINGGSWQFDVRQFAEVTLEGSRQVIGAPVPPSYPNLVCVFVRLRETGTDDFYILMWESLQSIVTEAHRAFLARHDGVRPRKPDSFHTAVTPAMMANHKDNWEALTDRL